MIRQSRVEECCAVIDHLLDTGRNVSVYAQLRALGYGCSTITKALKNYPGLVSTGTGGPNGERKWTTTL